MTNLVFFYLDDFLTEAISGLIMMSGTGSNFSHWYIIPLKEAYEVRQGISERWNVKDIFRWDGVGRCWTPLGDILTMLCVSFRLVCCCSVSVHTVERRLTNFTKISSKLEVGIVQNRQNFAWRQISLKRLLYVKNCS